jgi:uncharacterized OB-fold protein
MAYNGPMPSVTEESAGFFEAAKRQEFALHRCNKCGRWYWPASACTACDNEPFMANMEWTPASGRGQIFACITARRTFHPQFQAPFVYGLVKTEEGPLIPCGIDVAPEDARVGLPVEVYFVELSEEYTVPRFRALKA